MTSILRRLRAVVARSDLLHRIVQSRRSRRTLRQYARTREQYAGQGTGVLAPGYLRAHSLLRQRWSGPRRRIGNAREARLFCAMAESDATLSTTGGAAFSRAPTMFAELIRSFDVRTFDVSPFLPRDPRTTDRSWRARLQADLLAAYRAADAERPVDLVLLYLNYYHCDPATIEAIAASGAAVAILSLDDKHKYDARPSGTRPLVRAATVCLTSTREALRWYAADGAVGYHFPQAADPDVFRALDVPKDIDVSFVGAMYGARRQFLTDLRGEGVRVECFGPATEHGPVPLDEMVRVFNRSRVNLGFGGTGETGELTTLKGRDFEIPMTGSVYLTQYDYELADLFRVGEEVACYRNHIDCAEQIHYFLEQPDRAALVGRAARVRALAHHTWTRRVEDLLRWLGITADDPSPATARA